jgi:putative ABC transport system substrate-binding protein
VERLHQLGWIEGRTVAIEYRWSEGRPERIAGIAAEFVRQKVDVIVAGGSAIATLKQATAVTPIVFAIANDPLGSGMVARGAIQSDALTLRLFVIRPVGSDWRASRFCRT